jgi:hypothetical protein
MSLDLQLNDEERKELIAFLKTFDSDSASASHFKH